MAVETQQQMTSGTRAIHTGEPVLDQFLGDADFPIEWRSEVEQELFWVFDDLHCPHPLSPMFFDIGGWWLTCDHMFRRFGTPFAVGLDHQERQRLPVHRGRARGSRAGVPTRWSTAPDTARACRSIRRTRAGWASTSTPPCPSTASTSSTGGTDRLVPEMSATSSTSRLSSTARTRCPWPMLAVLLEDAIDIHDRHWKIHWMLNFAQLSATLNLRAVMEKTHGKVDDGAARPAPELAPTTATGTRSRPSGR
jgi:hypothetical protein